MTTKKLENGGLKESKFMFWEGKIMLDKKEYDRKYYIGHKEEKKERNKQWRKDNPDRMKELIRIWHRNHPEKYNEYTKQWRKNHPEKRKEIDRQWAANNPEKVKAKNKKYHENNPEKIRKTRRNWERNTRRTNLKDNLSCRIKTMMSRCLKKNKNNRSWKNFVNYSLSDLIKHLKKTMPKGYSWNDYLNGRLHIDHIIPISAFNFTKPEHVDFKRCWTLKNLRLLPAEENIIKNDKLERPFQPALKLQERR